MFKTDSLEKVDNNGILREKVDNNGFLMEKIKGSFRVLRFIGTKEPKIYLALKCSSNKDQNFQMLIKIRELIYLLGQSEKYKEKFEDFKI